MATKFTGIKKASEYRRGELTKDILRLIGAGVVAGTIIAAPNTVQLLDYFTPKSPRERNKIWKAIKYLESKDKIRLEQDRNGNLVATLTLSGRTQISEDALWEMAVSSPRRWDRKWRIVMFDFPTRHERVRHSFRIKLEDLGFLQYQRSVFIYPHECAAEINTIAEWYGVKEHIRYIVATEINDMRYYAQLFDLL